MGFKSLTTDLTSQSPVLGQTGVTYFHRKVCCSNSVDFAVISPNSNQFVLCLLSCHYRQNNEACKFGR